MGIFGKISGSSFDRTSAVTALAVLLFICVYHAVAHLVKGEFWSSLTFFVSGAILAYVIIGSQGILHKQTLRAFSVSLVWTILILSIWTRQTAELDWFYLSSFCAYLLLRPKWANVINGAGLIALSLVLYRFSALSVLVVQMLPLLMAMALANIVCLQIRYLEKELDSSHSLDPLTGCSNRTSLQKEMLKAAGFHQRYQIKTSAIALKVHDMQTQIEALGHEKFDVLLVELIQVWKSRLRNTDTLGRYSDDVFIGILPSTSLTNATLLAEDLVKASEVYEFSVGGRVNVGFRVIEHDVLDSWEIWCNKLVNHI